MLPLEVIDYLKDAIINKTIEQKDIDKLNYLTKYIEAQEEITPALDESPEAMSPLGGICINAENVTVNMYNQDGIELIQDREEE